MQKNDACQQKNVLHTFLRYALEFRGEMKTKGKTSVKAAAITKVTSLAH